MINITLSSDRVLLKQPMMAVRPAAAITTEVMFFLYPLKSYILNSKGYTLYLSSHPFYHS